MILHNSYKKAMDRMELSEKSKEKIIKSASALQEKKPVRPAYPFRKMAGLAACFVLCILSYHAVENHSAPQPEKIISADTPVVTAPAQPQPSCKESSAISEDTTAPPVGQKTETLLPKQEITIEDPIYAMEDELPFIAKGKVSAEEYNEPSVSQNELPYEFMEIVTVNGTDVVLKGRGDLYYHAAWFDGEDAFSITNIDGVEKEVMIELIISTVAAEQPSAEYETE